MKDVVHETKLTNPTPFKERFTKIPPPLVEEVRLHVKEMLEAGVIWPSKSPWSNTMVLVRKKDGGLRLCVDFRRLNSRTIPDSHTLPRIDETLDKLRGMCHFYTLDLQSRFWQTPIKKESQLLTAFMVGNPFFFEFLKMPFGLTNAPPTFQRAMVELLDDLNLKIVINYLDDLITCANSETQHLERLKQVFEKILQNNLKLKPKKCKFFRVRSHIWGIELVKKGSSLVLTTLRLFWTWLP